MSVRASTWAWEQIRSHGLRGTDALVLLRVADHANGEGACWPGVGRPDEDTMRGHGLAPYCGDESTVRRALGRLEDVGLLSRQRRGRSAGRGRGADLIQLALGACDQPGDLPAESATSAASTSDAAPEAELRDRLAGPDDQPGDLPAESVHDQPGISSRPTGHFAPDQPGISPSPIDRRTVREPSGNRPPPPSAREGELLVGGDLDEPSHSPEVHRLCELHCDLVNARTNRKKPYTVSGEWLTEMDRLLRIDGRTPAEVEAVIRFVDRDPFWRANVLAVTKLRKQFDSLLLRLDGSSERTQDPAARRRSSPPSSSSSPAARISTSRYDADCDWLATHTPELANDADRYDAIQALTLARRAQAPFAGEPAPELVRRAFAARRGEAKAAA